MTQITARIPDRLLETLDDAALTLRRSRADVVRHAIEYYLDDFEDLRASIAVLRDPADPVVEWESVRGELLGHE